MTRVRTQGVTRVGAQSVMRVRAQPKDETIDLY